MKILSTIILLLISTIAYAQSFEYPKLADTTTSINSFAPDGWVVLDNVLGDLNGDNINDAVIVLHRVDSVMIIEAQDSLITYPRILLIAFRTKEGQFHKIVQSNKFIINRKRIIDLSFNTAAPYEGIYINNGVLEISFQLFYLSGSWYITNGSYKFRYQDHQFKLIGADYLSFHRATHDSEEYSFNFLTKKYNVTKMIADEQTSPTEWHKLKIDALKTFDTFEEPFTWEVIEGLYL